MPDRRDRRYDKPPETEEDWADLWEGSQKAHKAWVVVGPIYAVATNWKALAITVLFIVAINSEEALTFIRSLPGVPK